MSAEQFRRLSLLGVVPDLATKQNFMEIIDSINALSDTVTRLSLVRSGLGTPLVNTAAIALLPGQIYGYDSGVIVQANATASAYIRPAFTVDSTVGVGGLFFPVPLGAGINFSTDTPGSNTIGSPVYLAKIDGFTTPTFPTSAKLHVAGIVIGSEDLDNETVPCINSIHFASTQSV